MKRRWIVTVAVVILLPLVSLYAMSLFSRAPTNLGVKAGQLAACPNSPNCVSSQAEDAEHAIPPLEFKDSPVAALDRLKRVIASLPRTNIVSEEPSYLRVEFTSALFRFVDDVEFLVVPDEGVIHMRSASRVGYSDFGANRKRLEQVRGLFQAARQP